MLSPIAIDGSYSGNTALRAPDLAVDAEDVAVAGVVGARRRRSLRCGAALVVADLLALAAAFAIAVSFATLLRPYVGSPPDATLVQDLASSGENTLLVFMVLTLCLAARGHYRDRLAFWSEARDLVAAGALALLGASFLDFSRHSNGSRLLVTALWLAWPLLVIPLRQSAKRGLTALGVWQIPVVVVGDERGVADALALFASEPVPAYRVVAVRSGVAAGAAEPGWLGILLAAGAEELVLALSFGSAQERALIPSVVRQRVPFAVISQGAGLPVFGCERTPFFSHDAVMFSYNNNLAQPVARAVKLTFDLALAALLLVVLAPLMLLLALLIRGDGGPALYGHPRIGCGGRPFVCLKFRTMVPEADTALQRLLAADPAAAREWAETRKLRDDPRVTWIGRFLRHTSLDELPQLLNVLRLEMSLVGPRPIVAQEIPRYAEDIIFYYEARPGLTGLWQVSGRSETSYRRRVELDCWYVKNWTVWYDLVILLKTLPVVLGRRGAR